MLADDPGAGKRITAGLFSKELMIRGDVERCLIVVPGNLVEQWQDELWQKFGLKFEILTKEMIEVTRSGNSLTEKPLLIARLDHLDQDQHRAILHHYHEVTRPEVPIRAVVRPGQRERYADQLGGLDGWEHEPTVADLDGFAASVDASDRTT